MRISVVIGSVALTLAAREWAPELPALARHGAKAIGQFQMFAAVL